VQSQSHQEFLELCALSTTEELTAEERKRLKEHLVDCDECRDLKEQYERVIATTIPELAANSVVEGDDAAPSGSWSIERAEQALMKSIDREPLPSNRSVRPGGASGWKLPLFYAAAAGLLSILSFSSYRMGVHRGQNMGLVTAPPTSASINVAGHSSGASVGASQSFPKDELDNREILQLRDQNRSHLGQIAKLKETQSQLEAEITSRTGDLNRSLQDRAELSQQLVLAQSNSEGLQAQLTQLQNQKTVSNGQSSALEAQVKDLGVTIEAKNQEISREQELLQRDRDIRNLIGARDLYIAEIYDVAKTGTQKPFGRVFYTKDKSLIFYGYDLDQQQGAKDASTFQAWGRRGSDQQHDVSLGFLYEDDASKKRWVLKSNDATTLAQIDAVFVTLEPKGGSVRPSGKPLLFTYLRLDPNHP
jgi:hypothetical protein